MRVNKTTGISTGFPKTVTNNGSSPLPGILHHGEYVIYYPSLAKIQRSVQRLIKRISRAPSVSWRKAHGLGSRSTREHKEGTDAL